MAQECTDMLTVMPNGISQQVAIYTKLEIFKTAGDKVRDLLRTVLEHSGVQVVLYKDWEKASENVPVTVMVVIDARQTRTLITPDRGDRNVDHVDELRKLESETSPKGSILIVIYGDEHSFNLREEEHVAKHWLQSWKFNDTKAYDLAMKGRCFSIDDNFNEKQKEMLRQYFECHWVPITPDVRVNTSIIVMGEKCKEQVSYLYSNNPFHRELPTDGSEDETQYGYFSFAPSGKEPAIGIDFNTSLYEVKVCESDDFREALVSQLKNLNTITPSKSKRPPYDNALLSCHCPECYKILMQHRDEVRAVMNRETFDVMNDVIPVVIEDQAAYVSREARNYINEVRLKTKQRSIQEGEMDAKSLLQASILTACQDKTTHLKKIKYICRKYIKPLCAALVIIVIMLIYLLIYLFIYRFLASSKHRNDIFKNHTHSH
ncbi:uncharacterized protein [Ptychodera flava]|uniref:uncharacterized protein n=1 Tax=Ptychodera flava TaxID=63121 RepID=UPI003969C4DA